MIWLDSPPWGRWVAATLIAVAAMWVEFRPAAMVEHPFAVEDLAPGVLVDAANTELRRIPLGLIDPVELGRRATTTIRAGDPVLGSHLDEERPGVPGGWWEVELPVPAGAEPGDLARVVILDTGAVAEGRVVDIGREDPLAAQLGTIAVEPEHAAQVAAAAAEGRVAVMIATR